MLIVDVKVDQTLACRVWFKNLIEFSAHSRFEVNLIRQVSVQSKDLGKFFDVFKSTLVGRSLVQKFVDVTGDVRGKCMSLLLVKRALVWR